MALDSDGQPQAAGRTSAADDRRLRAVLESIGDVVVVIDADGTLCWVSPSIETLSGFAPGDLVGRPVFDFLDAAYHDEHVAFLAEIVGRPGLHGPRLVTAYGRDGRALRVEVLVVNRLDDAAVGGVVVVAREVGARLAAEEVIRRNEELAQALVQRASDMVLVLDGSGVVVWASGSVTAALGYLPDALIGSRGLDLVAPIDRRRATAAIAAAVPNRPDEPLVVQLIAADRSLRLFEVDTADLLDNPAVAGVVLTARDVTQRRRAEQLLAEEAAVLERIARRAPTTTILSDLATVVERHLSGVACTIGAMESDGVIRHPSAPTLPAQLTGLLDGVDPSSSIGASIRGATDLVHYEDIGTDPLWGSVGQAFADEGFAACWMGPVLSPSGGGVIGAVTVFLPKATAPSTGDRALVERVRHLAAIAIEGGQFEAALEHRALHDGLTGLPNRMLLLDRLEQALARSRRSNTDLAVLFVDLDQFKVVNDSLGHDAGDRLLIEVGARFRQVVRAADTVARLGGDEFAVLCEGVHLPADAVAVAQHLQAALAEPFRVANAELFVTCSVGIAIGRGDDPEALIRDADAAMYRAKELGRNRSVVFEAAFHQRMVRRLLLQRDVRAALADGEFSLRYQPRVRVADGRITGVEALLRWIRPDGVVVGADEVITVAEETGFIVTLGTWVLQQACRQAAAWSRGGGDHIVMSVNLSGRQLVDPALGEIVAATLAEEGLDPSLLCLEVTESELAGDAGTCVEALGALKRIGVRVAIDDFGTGYATLDYVRRFAMADELKIDRSFVAGLHDIDSPDAAIVSAAIVLANALGFETVAEGVETPDQLAVLRQLGCEHAQGYLYSPPVTADELAILLARGTLTH